MLSASIFLLQYEAHSSGFVQVREPAEISAGLSIKILKAIYFQLNLKKKCNAEIVS